MAENLNTPWTARRDDSGGEPGLWSVIDTSGAVVFFGMPEKVARLLAGAPDMLTTLKAVVRWAEKNNRWDKTEWRDVYAAIAKASAAPKQPGAT